MNILGEILRHPVTQPLQVERRLGVMFGLETGNNLLHIPAGRGDLQTHHVHDARAFWIIILSHGKHVLAPVLPLADHRVPPDSPQFPFVLLGMVNDQFVVFRLRREDGKPRPGGDPPVGVGLLQPLLAQVFQLLCGDAFFLPRGLLAEFPVEGEQAFGIDDVGQLLQL